MRGEKTRVLKCYLRGGADRQLVSRLLADRSRGLTSSEVCRRALRQYYRLDSPTPPAPATDELVRTVAALADEVAALRAEVRAMHDVLRWTLRLGE